MNKGDKVNKNDKKKINQVFFENSNILKSKFTINKKIGNNRNNGFTYVKIAVTAPIKINFFELLFVKNK